MRAVAGDRVVEKLTSHIERMTEDYKYNLNVLEERDQEIGELEARVASQQAENNRLKAALRLKTINDPQPPPPPPPPPARPTEDASSAAELRALRETIDEVLQQARHVPHAAAATQTAQTAPLSPYLKHGRAIPSPGRCEQFHASGYKQPAMPAVAAPGDAAVAKLQADVTKYRARARAYCKRYRQAEEEVRRVRAELQDAYRQVRTLEADRDSLLRISNRQHRQQAEAEAAPRGCGGRCGAPSPPPAEATAPPPAEAVAAAAASTQPAPLRTKPRPAWADLPPGRGADADAVDESSGDDSDRGGRSDAALSGTLPAKRPVARRTASGGSRDPPRPPLRHDLRQHAQKNIEAALGGVGRKGPAEPQFAAFGATTRTTARRDARPRSRSPGGAGQRRQAGSSGPPARAHSPAPGVKRLGGIAVRNYAMQQGADA